MAVLRWARRRPVASAAVLYAVLAIAFVSPGLAPGRTLSPSDQLWSLTPWEELRPADVKPLGSNFDLTDQSVQSHTAWQFAREDAPDMPLWNPHIMGGHPFVGNFQSAVFSPFTAPAYVLPFWDSLAWMAALKLFVASLGAFLLARAVGARQPGALLAGVVFAFGFHLVAWLGFPLSAVWVWLPWALYLADAIARRSGPGPVAGLAAVTAVQFFGGHPESCFHVMFATVVFFAVRLVTHQSRGARVRPVVAFASALAIGAAIAAVTIAPFLEAVAGSEELAERSSASPDKIDFKFVFGVMLPDYWGRPTEQGVVGFLNNRAFYVGALPLMLAAAAVLLRPTRGRLAAAFVALGAVAVVTAIPPLHQIVNALPIFSSVHNGRLVIFWLLATAILAGLGLDELTRARSEPRTRRFLWFCGGLAAFPLVWLAVGRPGPSDLGPALETAWLFASPPDDLEVIRLASLVVWLTFAAAAFFLVRGRLRGRLGPQPFALLALALVVADLFRIGVGLNPAIAEDNAVQPTTGAIRYLQERAPRRFAGASNPGQQTRLPLEPNLAMRYGLYDARGYDFPLERRYTKFWKSEVSDQVGIVPSTRLAPINVRSLRALSLLGTADVIADPDDPPLRTKGLRLAYAGSDARVYENENALPRAFVVGSQSVVDGEDAALAAVGDPRFEPRGTVVVEDAFDGLPQGRPDPDPAGTARIVGYEPERVVVRAEADSDSVLVLTDRHAPGWRARVDGSDAPLRRVDYLLRGVPLSPGRHEVEFRYEPVSWRVGWILSVLGIVALAALCLIAWTRRRSPS
jgi:hypothetical protein